MITLLRNMLIGTAQQEETMFGYDMKFDENGCCFSLCICVYVCVCLSICEHFLCVDFYSMYTNYVHLYL